LDDARRGQALSITVIPHGYLNHTVATTTIKLDAKTRDALQAMKGRRTYDEVLTLLMRLVPEGDDEGKFSPEFRFQLLEAQLDIQHGRTHRHDDVMREFGLA
jgi:hypothetical protein